MEQALLILSALFCVHLRLSNIAREFTLGAERQGVFGHAGVEEPRRMEWLEPVPDTEDGLDVLVRISAQLLAKPADMNVERARADFGAVAPNPQKQRFARNDFACMLHQ